MKVIEIDPRNDPLWLRLIEEHGGSVFGAPPWLDVLVDTYGFRIRALVAVNHEGDPLSGLCFVELSDWGETIVSLPFSDYCDPLVSDEEQWDVLIRELMERKLPIDLRCLSCVHPSRDSRFTIVNSAVWHGIDLRADVETIRRGFHKSARQSISLAGRTGVEVRIADDEALLRRFYELHVGVRKRKYQMLAQPYRFFESIWRHFIEPGKGALMVAIADGEVLAGTLYLEWGGTLYYKFNASDPAHLKRAPNDLLVWEGVKYARARGCSRLDFGLSDRDQEGLIHFKRKYANQEAEIVALRHEPDGWDPSGIEQLRSMMQSVTPLLASDSVPDHVTASAGGILYRLFAYPLGSGDPERGST